MQIQPLFIGTTELLLIGGIALLLFGGKKLPEMMRGLGQGVREFKKGVNDVKEGNLEDENTVPDTSADESSNKHDSVTSDEIKSNQSDATKQ